MASIDLESILAEEGDDDIGQGGYDEPALEDILAEDDIYNPSIPTVDLSAVVDMSASPAEPNLVQERQINENEILAAILAEPEDDDDSHLSDQVDFEEVLRTLDSEVWKQGNIMLIILVGRS